jgi:hypothetical protein
VFSLSGEEAKKRLCVWFDILFSKSISMWGELLKIREDAYMPLPMSNYLNPKYMTRCPPSGSTVGTG